MLEMNALSKLTVNVTIYIFPFKKQTLQNSETSLQACTICQTTIGRQQRNNYSKTMYVTFKYKYLLTITMNKYYF